MNYHKFRQLNQPSRSTIFNSKIVQGFTLIELIVVIAIIGILSTLAVVSFNDSRSKARDSERLSDVRAIQGAVELYIENNGTAPDPFLETWTDLQALIGVNLQAGTLPLDPLADDGYKYVYCHAGHNYLLAAVMENDQAIANDLDGAHGYTVASECIFSAADNNVLNCVDAAGGGEVSGTRGSVFCAGYAKGT